MTDPYTIRAARADELSTVLYHRRQMYIEMGYTDVAALDAMERSSAIVFGEALRTGAYRGWFAEAEGQVIAGSGVLLVPFQPSPRDSRPARPFIVNVYTEVAHRRRGLARRLVEVMVEWCRTEDYGGVSLHATDTARPLYASMGFAPTNEMRLGLR